MRYGRKLGQALAYVCRARGLALVVYCATTANALKVQRMRAMGAEVRLYSENFDAAKKEAKHFCKTNNAVFVEDGLELSISEGAGTIARELLQTHSERIDTLLIPLGNGALLNGMARWVKAHAPQVRVIGICAKGADSMAVSWQQNRVIERTSVHTIADGIAVRCPVPEALQDMYGQVDEVLLVSEESIEGAMRQLFQHAGLLVEPSGAVGVAAVLEHAGLRARRLATVLCGSNLTPDQVARWLF